MSKVIENYDYKNDSDLTTMPYQIEIEPIPQDLLALASTSNISSDDSNFLSDDHQPSTSYFQHPMHNQILHKSTRPPEQYKINLRVLDLTKLARDSEFSLPSDFDENEEKEFGLFKTSMRTSPKAQHAQNQNQCNQRKIAFSRPGAPRHVKLNETDHAKNQELSLSETQKFKQIPIRALYTPELPENLLESPSPRKNLRATSVSRKSVKRRNETRRSSLLMENEWDEGDEDIIRCICGLNHSYSFMIVCERCKVLQHAICMGITKKNVPEVYYCEKCEPRVLYLSSTEAANIQKIHLMEKENMRNLRKMLGKGGKAKNITDDDNSTENNFRQNFYEVPQQLSTSNSEISSSTITNMQEGPEHSMESIQLKDFRIYIEPIPNELLTLATVTDQTEDYPDYLPRNPNICESSSDDSRLYYAPSNEDEEDDDLESQPRLLQKEELLLKKFQVAMDKRKNLNNRENEDLEKQKQASIEEPNNKKSRLEKLTETMATSHENLAEAIAPSHMTMDKTLNLEVAFLKKTPESLLKNLQMEKYPRAISWFQKLNKDPGENYGKQMSIKIQIENTPLNGLIKKKLQDLEKKKIQKAANQTPINSTDIVSTICPNDEEIREMGSSQVSTDAQTRPNLASISQEPTSSDTCEKHSHSIENLPGPTEENMPSESTETNEIAQKKDSNETFQPEDPRPMQQPIKQVNILLSKAFLKYKNKRKQEIMAMLSRSPEKAKGTYTKKNILAQPPSDISPSAKKETKRKNSTSKLPTMIPLTSLSIKVPLQQDVPNKPKNGTDNLMKKLGKQTSQKSENFLNQNLEDPKEIDRETMEIDSLPKDQEKTRLVNLGLRNNQNEQEDVEMMDINEIRVKEQENSENVVEPRINGIVDRNIENLSQEMEDSPAAISNSYQSSGSQVVFTSNNRVHSLARKRSSNPESLVRDQAKMIRMNTTRLLNQTPDSSSPTLQIPSSDVSIPSTYMLTPKKFNNTPLPSPSSTIVSSASNVPRTPTPMDPWTSNTTSTSIASQQWHINTSHPSTSNLASSNMVADSMHVSRLSNLVTINRIPPIDSQIGDPVISQHGTRFYPAQPKVSSSRKPTFPAQTGRQNLQIPVINLDHQSTSRSIENISTVPRSGGACALQNGPRTRISPKKPRSHKQSDQAFIYMVHRSGYFTLERKYPLTKNMIPPRYIPCTDLDIPVPLKVPFDPINEFGLESLYEAFRMHVESVKMDFNQAVPVQHLFLADTLYFAFNHKIFENAHMIRIEAKALSKHDSFWCRLELLDWADHCLRAINLDKIKIENRFNILYILLQQYGVQFKK